jgi:hypothetical protein
MGKALQAQEYMRCLDDTLEFVDEPGLPNPTHTRQKYHPSFTRKRFIHAPAEEAQFLHPAHQRREYLLSVGQSL